PAAEAPAAEGATETAPSVSEGAPALETAPTTAPAKSTAPPVEPVQASVEPEPAPPQTAVEETAAHETPPADAAAANVEPAQEQTAAQEEHTPSSEELKETPGRDRQPRPQRGRFTPPPRRPIAGHPHTELLRKATEDALSRLLAPSLEREIRRELSSRAESHAVSVFARNLRSKLLSPPLRGK